MRELATMRRGNRQALSRSLSSPGPSPLPNHNQRVTLTAFDSAL
jgi:hypothetical protein